MKCRTLLLVAACAALLVVNSATADDLSLVVGEIQMKLGMAREPLLERLRAKYKLTEFGKDGYAIAEKKAININGQGQYNFLSARYPVCKEPGVIFTGRVSSTLPKSYVRQ